MKIRSFIFISILAFVLSGCCGKTDKITTGVEDREYCVALMRKIVDPVLDAVLKQELDATIPRKEWELQNKSCDIRTTTLQAVGRSLSGLSPWLSLGADQTPEGRIRAEYIEKARTALINITNPKSNDYLFDKESETYERIVHNAYIAYPLLIAPAQLWAPLTAEQRTDVINALKSHRAYTPFKNNWMLFSSLIEAAIWKLTGECEMEVIDNGIQNCMSWYKGDGVYGDGAQFHWDYYNSYVIHPLMMEILRVAKEIDTEKYTEIYNIEKGRAVRFAEIQEHLISPEGTYPVIGRSNAYRIASFQHLGYMAYRGMLPKGIKPGSTRAALMAVTKNLMEAPGTFDENGWLNPGIYGEQLNARDIYTVTGALYMCTMGLTQLGIPAEDPFWSDPASKWFQQQVWSGEDIGKQHEYYGK